MADLEERVARLEGLAAAAAQPAYSPLSGMQITPDGAVAYDFDGHISARGLDLDAQSLGSPRDDRHIRWARTSDGAAVAEILGVENEAIPTHAELNLWAHRADRTTGTLLYLYDDADPTIAGLKVSVTPQATGQQQRNATILDAAGHSDFVQAATQPGLRLAALEAQVFFNASAAGNVTLNHGLPVRPTWVALGARGLDQANHCAWEWEANATQLLVWGFTRTGFAIGPGNVAVSCLMAYVV